MRNHGDEIIASLKEAVAFAKGNPNRVKLHKLEDKMTQDDRLIESFPTGEVNVTQTFSNAEDRTRLTPTALKAVIKISDAWQLKGGEAATLLGMSERVWNRIRARKWRLPLSQDQLLRASAIIGIWHDLHILFADSMADRWPRLENSNPLFENRSPIEAMAQGGIPMMLGVRRHVEALRGSL